MQYFDCSDSRITTFAIDNVHMFDVMRRMQSHEAPPYVAVPGHMTNFTALLRCSSQISGMSYIGQ